MSKGVLGGGRSWTNSGRSRANPPSRQTAHPTPTAAIARATSPAGNVIAGTVTYLPYYQHSLPIASSFILAYLFIFLLCMLGNGLVCLIVLRNRRMRTVTNLFILNLAVSDLLVGIFCIPTTLVDNLITGWPFSNVVCKMSGLIQGMSVSASVFTLVAIAVDRVEDHYMVHNEDYNHTYPLYSCYENWPQVEMRKVYTTVLFAHIYLAPLTLIILMYGRIGVKLYTTSVLSGREHPETTAPPCLAPPGGHPEGRPLVSHKKVKVIKMLIVVALLFVLSWLPLWSLMMLTDYGGLDAEQLELLTSYVFPFAHWLAFSNSTVNPIIYGYYNKNFKRGFQAVCQPYSGSCCRAFLWGGSSGGGVGLGVVEGRVPKEGSDRAIGPRNGGANSNPIVFGARNRVYTNGDLAGAGAVRLELEWRKGVGVGSAPYMEGLGAAGGRIGGVSSNMGVQTADTEKVSLGESGVCQAWDQ
ncbi:hypothetical protein SKAU_G00010170 [Synaphobranchus kaupii]|uniref:G-protein coupled receptors family 1 profile domain-containing protein n=1 Tax=Synaphobranchus kaupii TaxID=118154 RepID=A0A9Q1G9T8_SYNKA|nr:hypothetical protein SKAU_G00010170 [Synaphobranchus kaupii]